MTSLPSSIQVISERQPRDELEEWRDRALRLQAEMGRYRRRQQRLAQDQIEVERQRLLGAFLQVVDDLERALAAPASGEATIDTFGSNYDTYLTVWIGSPVGDLTEVARNDDADDVLQSKVEFNVVAGTMYQIAVDGYEDATGNIALNITAPGVVPTGNDLFVNGTDLGSFGI